MENADAGAALPLYDLAAPLTVQPPPEASEAAKRAAYCQIADAYRAAASALYYKWLSPLRLTMDVVQALVATRLTNEFLPGLLRLCPAFESFPLPARRALVDMAYNLGVGGLEKFPHLLAACNAGDWATAAAQCHRSTCRDTRNVWTAQMFVSASAPPPVAVTVLSLPSQIVPAFPSPA